MSREIVSLSIGWLLSAGAVAQDFKPKSPVDIYNNQDYQVVPPPPKQKPLDAVNNPYCDSANRGTALMIIDMQNYFALRNGRGLRRENDLAIKGVVTEQLKAIENAKKAKLPIIIVAYDDVRLSGELNNKLKDAIDHYPEATMIKKTQDSVFDNQNTYRRQLAEILRKEKIRNLIVTGANGGACVQQSIGGALAANCNVLTIEKGIADFNYKKFIYPYRYDEDAVREFQNSFDKSCVGCVFKQVRSADDAAVFMKPNSNDVGPTREASDEVDPNATK